MLLSYLKALEIDVWLPRDRPRAGPEPPAGVAPFGAASDAGLRSAGSGGGWAEPGAAVRDCVLCPLEATRTPAVVGVGDRTAQGMVIGEAPGMEEDRKGEPFVGRAGQL